MGKVVDIHCRAFQAAIEVLSRPWNGLILGLLQEGPLRFGELEERTKGVGPKMLSARLKSLEALGIVTRRIEPGPPIRVQYSLTGKGAAFQRVAESIQQWGQELLSNEPDAARAPEARRAASRSR